AASTRRRVGRALSETSIRNARAVRSFFRGGLSSPRSIERERNPNMKSALSTLVVCLAIGAGARAHAGVFRPFKAPTANSPPRQITLGPDGNRWFAESDINVSQIARSTPNGRITEFVVPTRFSQPSDIVAGPDGALWFTEPTGNAIGRITTAGAVTEFV